MKNYILFSVLFLMQFSAVGQIASKADMVKPIKVGEFVPETNLKTSDGLEVSTSDLFEGKNSVLVFYRGGWCPYCNKHLAALKSLETELKELGYQILAVSPDRYEKLPISTNKHDLGYTLLSDSKMALTKSMGLAFQISDEEFERLKKYGMDLEESSGEKHHLLPVPAIFIINENKQILYRHYNADYKTRLDNKELLKTAKDIAS